MKVSRKTRVTTGRQRLLYAALIAPALLLAAVGGRAVAGPLAASSFQTYDSANAAGITPGPFALYTVNVASLRPTQMDEGLAEVGKKTAGFDLLTPAQLPGNLLTDIEPVVIGPGGVLYLTDGHHTFTALLDSVYGASNPTVYVNVIANYSNLTPAQFFATMQAQNLLMPLNDGVPQTVNLNTGAPIPTSLTGLVSDPYRGLEYSILKNKSSKLFPTASNITGAVGAATPGLDKMTGFYSDFLEAAAYRNANGGLGLAYLSPGDIALATQWNLNPASVTTLPNVPGTVTAAQLPGFILAAPINLTGVISNATLAGGALDGNGTFTGVTTINAGTPGAPITIGTPNTGFVMELGADKGNTVTLSGANTYAGGTSILAGTLIVANDAALGATAPVSYTIDPNNIKTSVQAANGIVFNSLTEGAGTLQIGTAAGGGVSTFSTNRPIAVDGETAVLNLNGFVTTLTGQIVSLGANGFGLGNATGESDLTIDDNSANQGVLILNGNNPGFFGNIIIGLNNKPTVEAFSDAALGNTTGPAASIGQIVLNGGTFKAGAAFNSVRTVSVQSKSTFDTNSFSTVFAGPLSDVQRNVTFTNTGLAAGAVSFGALKFGSALELIVSKGTGTSTNLNFTGGIQRSASSDQLLLKPNSGTFGSVETVTTGAAAQPTLTNGIVAPWLIIDSGAANNPYDFATYGPSGFTAFSGYATNIATATATSVVKQSASAALAADAQAYALDLQKGFAVTATGHTLTLGDGTNAGLILNGGSGSGITGGALAFGTANAFISINGSSTISAAISGSGGLNLDGTGTLTISAPSTESGLITVNSGTLALTGTNVFSASAQGLLLQDTKNLATANLSIAANNQFAALNSAGNNSSITITGGSVLTIGDASNLGSTLSSTITDATVTAGAIIKNGTGLLDLSGGSITLAAGSSIAANGGQLRVATGALKNTAVAGSAPNFVLAGGADLQFAQNGGGQYAGAITGAGSLHLIGGTLQLTGTANTYSGGTIVETGSILDLTTANLPSATPNITAAGGLIVFDQATTGTYAGVISDGKEMGTGPMLSGSLDKDDSSGGNTGNLILTSAQAYTGATTVEAGTLTLNAADTLAASSGVDLGRIGGGATAIVALGANNAVQALSSEAGDTTSVTLGANTLTINTGAATAANFRGAISGAGAVVKTGAGTEVFSGANVYSGGTTVQNGLLSLTGSINSAGTTTVTGGTLAVATSGALTTSATTVGGGALDVSGVLTSPTITVNGGLLDIANHGSVLAATTNVNGGVVELDAGGSFSSTTAVNVAAGGTFFAPGGAASSVTPAFNNAGALDIRNGVGTNVFTVGAYAGTAGSQLLLGANFTTKSADELVVASATGTTAIAVTDLTAATPLAYNPTGIAVVASTGAMSASAFTLAGGPVQKGLFRYDLAYTPDPHFLLVSVPAASAFRLSTLPTAAQSIWQDTAGVWLDRQNDERDLLEPSAGPAANGPATGLWARAVGDWSNRTQTQTYSLLNKTYNYQTGYNRRTDGIYAGYDGGIHGPAGRDDMVLFGGEIGYIDSAQTFKASTAAADFQGWSVGLSATYLNQNFFADALFKADFLEMSYSDPSIAGFGASRQSGNVASYGGVIDAGYRFDFGGSAFLEPQATVTDVSARLDGLALAGSQVTFSDQNTVRGRLGVRGGMAVIDDAYLRVDVSATGSYWARLSGGSAATINSGASAPLLTLTDSQVKDYGEAGLGLNVFSKTSGWNAFLKGDYQFGSSYDAGSVKGGVRYDF